MLTSDNNAPDLHALQALFIRALRDDEAADKLFTSINETQANRINAYRANLRFGLINTLAIAYPATKNLLGDTLFSHLALAYDNYAPLRNLDLDAYGKQLATFVRQHLPTSIREPIAKQHIPMAFLSDLCETEEKAQVSYSSANRKRFDGHRFEKLREEDYHDVVFSVSPDVQLIQSRYPLDTLWKASLKNQITQFNCSHACCFCLHRPHVDVEIIAISEQKATLLREILSNVTFARLLQNDNNVEMIVELVSQGWIHDFTTL